ncbi:MAG: aldehyde dehydrogenase family protein [Candidatus Omnitrophica bacterium]|nr:aldehyde dehydrogenase family protein [Candidatus Omnitrophota bacterium]
MAQSKKYLNYIGGRWIPAKSGKTFPNINPANKEEVIGLLPESGSGDVDLAVKAAEKAYGEWRLVPPPKRAEYILKASLLIQKRKEELARLMTREMGKVLRETRGDIQETIDMGFYVAGEGRRLFGQTTTSELKDKFAMSVRMPIGVCGLITPWNFPMAIPSWKIFPALVCGNTVVFKPAEDTPLSAHKMIEILEEAGLPKGVVNLVHGGPSTGEAIVRHPRIRLISFTGSCEVGKLVAEHCGKVLKRCSLEMGGKNAQIVMEDADLNLALEGAVWGAYGTTGQRCTATSRVFVQEGIFEKFKKMFVERSREIKIGDGLKEGIEMGPIINEVQRKRVHEYVEIGKKEGAKLEIGGKFAKGKDLDKGFFYEPTVFTEANNKMRIYREEIFGPVACLISFKRFEDAIRMVNDTTYGLSSSIYSKDVNFAMRAIRDIEAGITYVNGPTIGAEVHLPFGGVKNTGNGHREGGETAIDIFSEWKSVFIDYSGKLQKAQIDVD